MDCEKLNLLHRHGGFQTIEETIELIEAENQVLEAFSTLIAARIKSGMANVFVPDTTLRSSRGKRNLSGDQSVFHSGCVWDATLRDISIGGDNQFGEGGFAASGRRLDACVRFGNDGPCVNGPSVLGGTSLSNDTRILASLQLVIGCLYREDDPVRHEGLLKWSGVVRNLHVRCGQVNSLQGSFAYIPTLRQLCSRLERYWT